MNINMNIKKFKTNLPQMIIMKAAYTNRMSFLGNKKVKFWDGETVPENKLPSILEVEQLEGLIGPHGAVLLEPLPVQPTYQPTKKPAQPTKKIYKTNQPTKPKKCIQTSHPTNQPGQRWVTTLLCYSSLIILKLNVFQSAPQFFAGSIVFF